MAMHLRGKRIFVVEDNVDNRVIYQLLFTREGAAVEAQALLASNEMMYVD